MPYQSKAKLPTKSWLKGVFNKYQKRALTDCARYIRAKAAKYPPKASSWSYKRTGTLGRSITYTKPEKRGRAWRVEVGTNLHYARYVEWGVGIYGPRRRPIVPVRAKALAFPVTGSAGAKRGVLIARGLKQRKGKLVPSAAKNVYMIFAKSVKGFKGWHYMEKAFKSPETATYIKARFLMILPQVRAEIESKFGYRA